MSTTTERKAYASDLTNEQWERIESLLPKQKEGGRERQVDLREIINAINYRTRTGCAWEMLPHDLPAKSTYRSRLSPVFDPHYTLHSTIHFQHRKEPVNDPANRPQ